MAKISGITFLGNKYEITKDKVETPEVSGISKILSFANTRSECIIPTTNINKKININVKKLT